MVRLRRARAVIVYWRDGRLVFENYRTKRLISADPLAATVLDYFDRWRSPAGLGARLPEYTSSSLRHAVQELTQHTLLVREGSLEAREDKNFDKEWSAWLPEAGFFHFGTKDTGYATTAGGMERIIRRLLAASPQPSFFKRYDDVRQVRLPRPEPTTQEFLRVVLSRRTRRHFSAAPLSLEALSRLLFYTWGVTGFARDRLLGRLPLKTSPSGGARHPGEVYVIAMRVDGLPAGLYHYSPFRHSLEQLRLGRMQRKAIRYCADQSWVGSAAALFMMTAVFRRTRWKYPTPRAYRLVLLEAGHLCQTFCLVACFLGLAPFSTIALRDSLIEKDLGLDGISESVLYLAGVGLPRSSAGAASRSRFLASL